MAIQGIACSFNRVNIVVTVITIVYQRWEADINKILGDLQIWHAQVHSVILDLMRECMDAENFVINHLLCIVS